MTRICILTVRL